MEAYNYQFTALRGTQSGREYYVAMCPLKLIPKIFLFDEEEIPPELRAQRVLNRARIPEIARYIVENPHEYVFSSITACIDGEVQFEPLAERGYGRNAGVLTISMTSRFLINDGQHRRAAIEEALKHNPHLGDESISVVFFLDAGLERSQQLFADLNKHAIRPTRSIGILYDRRDQLAHLSRNLIEEVPIFRGLTETEKTTISNRSTKLFTLSAIYQATQSLLNKGGKDRFMKADQVLATQYWTTLGETIPEWRVMIQRDINASELRRDYVHCHGVALHALGIAGRTLIETYPETWGDKLAPLAKMDWLRTNPIWEGRAMVRGKMSKAVDHVSLTANAIKQALGIPLMASEVELERSLHQVMGED
ncbi:DNA sulfur modification protein DndB [bacterium]|nr:DNA sulfur modification protein DndB [bacterium]